MESVNLPISLKPLGHSSAQYSFHQPSARQAHWYPKEPPSPTPSPSIHFPLPPRRRLSFDSCSPPLLLSQKKPTTTKVDSFVLSSFLLEGRLSPPLGRRRRRRPSRHSRRSSSSSSFPAPASSEGEGRPQLLSLASRERESECGCVGVPAGDLALRIFPFSSSLSAL